MSGEQRATGGAATAEPTGTASRRAPAAELLAVTAERGALRVRSRVSGVPAGTGLVLVAVSQHTGRQVHAPVQRRGGGVGEEVGEEIEAVLPLVPLRQAARPRDDTFFLSLGLSRGPGPLRLVRLRGPGGNPPAAYPVQTVRRPLRSTGVQVYVTVYGNVSVRVRETLPRSAGRPRRPAPLPVRWAVQTWLRRLERATAQGRREGRPTLTAGKPRVYFVIRSVYGMGGTIRTVLTTANHLASRGYQVTIISVLRPRETTFFPVHRKIRLVPLFDERTRTRPIVGDQDDHSLRAQVERRLKARIDSWQSVLTHPDERSADRTSLLTDVLLVRALQRCKPGVGVFTRPVLNVVGARLAPPQLRTLGQEHLNFEHYGPEVHRWMLEAYRDLDMLAVLTEGDAAQYREVLAGAPVQVRRIPNGLPRLPDRISDQTARVVVAVGRLSRQKGFDMLIPAYARVAERHPGWELRIFGDGELQDDLQDRIDGLGLTGRVRLLGRSDDVLSELAQASLYVMSSRFEGFPMVLLEAMSAGLPVVSFDCPRGPADLVEPGRNGLLVPLGDVAGLGDAVSELVADEERRRAMAAAARETAGRYAMDQLEAEWERAFRDLGGAPAALSG